MWEKMVVMLFCSASLCWGCGKGCFPLKGVCACDAPVADQDFKMPAEWVSDDRPPRSGMSACQAEGIHCVVNQPSLTQDDSNLDKEKQDADAIGKKAAGIAVTVSTQ
jgi:hypothetical protein